MKKQCLIVSTLLTFLQACGGGGSGQASVSLLVAGVYTGTVPTQVFSSCPATTSLPATLNVNNSFPHTVNQVSNAVVLDETDGTTWTGFIDSNNDGFTVRHDPLSVSDQGTTCVFTPFINYHGFNQGPLTMSFTIDINCANQATSAGCEVIYNSAATKIS